MPSLLERLWPRWGQWSWSPQGTWSWRGVFACGSGPAVYIEWWSWASVVTLQVFSFFICRLWRMGRKFFLLTQISASEARLVQNHGASWHRVVRGRCQVLHLLVGASLVAQTVKSLPPVWETQVWSLDREESPRQGNGNPFQYSCLENPIWPQRVGHNFTFTFTFIFYSLFHLHHRGRDVVYAGFCLMCFCLRCFSFSSICILISYISLWQSGIDLYPIKVILSVHSSSSIPHFQKLFSLFLMASMPSCFIPEHLNSVCRGQVDNNGESSLL